MHMMTLALVTNLLFSLFSMAGAGASYSTNVLHSGTQTSAGCGHRVVLGVDYYPEQWAVDDMMADMTAIRTDLGADFIRIGEFMWHSLEPQDGVFDFKFLDEVIAAAEKLELEVMLGTPTATIPAWLYEGFPDVFASGPDSGDGYAAAKPAFGGRRQASFHSQAYLSHAKRIVTKLAERYGKRKVVAFWQIDNELGNEQSDLDFSANAQTAWRTWLSKKYGYDIGALNRLWGTVFWSTTYDSFEQISLPTFTRPGGALQGEEEFRSNMNPALLLDYRRFRADALTEFSTMQVHLLRDAGVVGCITTNANGGYWGRALDNNAVNAEMDFPAFDNYPVWGGSLAPDTPATVAMMLDTVRGWTSQKDRSAGFMIAEQLIGAQGHDIIGYTPRPNQIIAWSAQTFLHGATSLAFFRYRAAVTGQEMFCYGILDHSTPRGQGRKWREAKQFYSLARIYEGIWLGPLLPQVALIYSIDSIFSWNAQPQSTAFDYSVEAHRLYYPFWRNGAAVDVITDNRVLQTYSSAEALFKRYAILLLPAPMIVPDALIPILEGFLDRGGVIWCSFRADLKDGSNAVRRSSSRLADLAGVQIEEIESLNKPSSVALHPLAALANGGGTPLENTSARVWRDGLRIVEGKGAKALWVYTDRFFGGLGLTAVSQRIFPNSLGASSDGSLIYFGSGVDPEALLPLASTTLSQKKVPHVGQSASNQVEQLLRQDVDGHVWRIAINYGEDSSVASDGSKLEPYEIDIRRLDDSQRLV